MRLLDNLRARSKAKREVRKPLHRDERDASSVFLASQVEPQLPDTILHRLFLLICPHSGNDGYASSEDSMTDGECPLCDLEDLAHCGLVNRQWNKCAVQLLYKNVRVDAVHFCGRPVVTSKKRSSFNAAMHSNDPARRRLESFVSTVRQGHELAILVQTLRIPYMTREAAYAVIARAVAAPLSNLRYLDCPEGIYREDPALAMLKAEIETNCPQLRSWKVNAGGEHYLNMLQEGLWPHLEELTLGEGLAVEARQFAELTKSLPTLSKISFLNLPRLGDELFREHDCRLDLCALIIHSTPRLTADGLVAYASRPAAGQALRKLTLIETAINIEHLSRILEAFPVLEVLHIILSVERPFSFAQRSLLASKSLRKLKYEIGASPGPFKKLASPAESYYEYLCDSVFNGSLPCLVHLFTLYAEFPRMLLGKVHTETGSNASFAWLGQTLHVYAKANAELEWSLTIFDPAADIASARQSTRPLSLYNAQQQQSTPFDTDNSRKSVMVGNGFGGFLTVPEQDGPLNAGRKSSLSRDRDEWWAS